MTKTSLYEMPNVTLLKDYAGERAGISAEEYLRKINILRDVLNAKKVSINEDITTLFGPAVSEYNVIPAPGTKVSKIKDKADDIAHAMGAVAVRISTHQDSLAIEIPNEQRSIVPLKSLINSKAFQKNQKELPLLVGYTIAHEVKILDLADAPHILIAGATKQGKSVCLNTMVISLLYNKRPDELKMVFIDPKMTEFRAYGKLLNHYLAVLPGRTKAEEHSNAIVTKAPDAADVLDALCAEMEARYKQLFEANVSRIKEYNCLEGKSMPYIVCFVDEYADLTVVFEKDKTISRRILTAIIRLAQRGRAAGIHMVIATHRPSADVITGLIKANFTTRIAFRTSSRIDSTVILELPGAEKLIGQGDMLLEQGLNMERLQGGYISEEEINSIVNYISSQKGFGPPYYLPIQTENAKG